MREDDLVYSTAALEAKATFYNKDYTIYVEGKDDLLFWDTICKYAKLSNYHIEDVGGEPINYYKELLTDDPDFIVACDLTYDEIKGIKNKSPKLVYTYGHSIENSMYRSIDRIDSAIKKYSKDLKSHREEIKSAIDELIDKIKKLIIYDIANEVFNKSVAVIANNCARYLKVGYSYHLCNNKINETINKISHLFEKEELEFCENRLNKVNKSLWFYIRGHFLTTWILKLIKYLCEQSSKVKIDITYNAIYSEFIECNKSDSDIKYLIRSLKRAKNSIYVT
ncbi:DUF4435 domain-containing protein [Mucilaginibacter sp. ZT4R22]|uniref:DUF4435 domain-containing protein n=1 Tax=Mucilaginibacter pankratovii TaxID=2772110 RepID=A0ABR7WLA2_9SPHI|nr:DUF4435 domain-containing protein [Mucilaginibacter pankratovii]MBD1362883.1 DUF4435 domain-containing protein [Mucilaginibacter pankratovii]